jgi:hypothetical protein
MVGHPHAYLGAATGHAKCSSRQSTRAIASLGRSWHAHPAVSPEALTALENSNTAIALDLCRQLARSIARYT